MRRKIYRIIFISFLIEKVKRELLSKFGFIDKQQNKRNLMKLKKSLIKCNNCIIVVFS